MKASLFSLFGLVAPLLAAPAVPIGTTSHVAESANNGHWIIRLKHGTSAEALTAHHTAVRSLLRRRDGQTGEIDAQWHIGNFDAYAGNFDEATLAEIANLPDVLSIEPDRIYYVDEVPVEKRDLTFQPQAPYHLGDISHNLPGSDVYVYDESAGEGQTAYIVDTGIRLSHVDFEGRARFGINALTGSTEPEGDNHDEDGHGTHVASIVAGKTWGVAKKADIVDVKVFAGRSTTTSAILNGVQWAVDDIVERDARASSVVNMSLGTIGGPDPVMEAGVRAATEAGVTIVVAAGNDDAPAANVSPARMPEVITVGMTTFNRTRVTLVEGQIGSNYGPELDIWAPGSDIWAAGHTHDAEVVSKTGTSMASPVVAGVVAYLRALEGGLEDTESVRERLIELSHKGVVSRAMDSPNRLVYNGSGQ